MRRALSALLLVFLFCLPLALRVVATLVHAKHHGNPTDRRRCGQAQGRGRRVRVHRVAAADGRVWLLLYAARFVCAPVSVSECLADSLDCRCFLCFARVRRRHVQGGRDARRARLPRVSDPVLAADFVSARLFDAHQVSVE